MDEIALRMRLRVHLSAVYAAADVAELEEELWQRIKAFPARQDAPAATGPRLSERDSLLITYGDQIQTPGERPLQTLHATLRALAGDALGGVHILPFFPYTSDDGFSVVDYMQVDPALGDWSDIARLSSDYRLMFDAVINHISQASAWFAAFQRNEAPYVDYFITVDPATDVSKVVRPRTLPLLTKVETVTGPLHVWTTFSADQIDLNFAAPKLLLEIIDLLLFYVTQGAELIRLDAIGYMWKELGTSCIHLPQTHALIQLMRTVLDATAPGTLLVTETNVPHAENISYFGNGYNEAQMVYNFTLPPLTLHAFQTGDAGHMTRWAAALTPPSPETAFFNFMASHDGIGLRPVEGILPPAEIEQMAARTLKHGGLVSYRTAADGSRTPYELNIVYYDALNNPDADESQALQVDRFMASQAILLSLAGVPGVYVHSLFGSRNWTEGVAQTGRNRTINRRKFTRAALEAELAEPDTVAHQVFARYKALLQVRQNEPAFHPAGAQDVVDLHPALFSFVRTAPDESSRVLCIHNVADRPVTLRLNPDDYFAVAAPIADLVSGRNYAREGVATLTMIVAPYGVLWLQQSATVDRND